MNRKQLYYRISASFLVIALIPGTLYRKYIYNRSINDFGIADMHPNILAVIVASFLFLGYMNYSKKKEELNVILGCTLGFILYEVIQLTPIIGIFDWKDILGTIIGSIATLAIYKFVNIKEA